jgi:DNA modification methylase
VLGRGRGVLLEPYVILGDGISGMSQLPAGSVGLVLSDLPSGETQAEFDEPPDLPRLWTETWRALRNGGVCLFMAHSFSFARAVVALAEKEFKYELVWHKSVATGFFNANKRPLRAHEYVLVFSKGQGIYEPQMIQGASPIHAARRKAGARSENYGKDKQPTASRAGATDRFPTSVLDFASVGTTAPERIHPQQKPVELLSWLVRTYSVSGDLVVDPYAGSGSTGVAALSCGRRFLGWDKSERFGTPIEALLRKSAENSQLTVSVPT